MGKLCMDLPPFSPDYSGVCSAIFPLNCLAVIHDGSGCTGNYTGYDEPRWFHSKAPIYCSGLREIDAILGDDEKLIQKIVNALDDIKPEMIALVGSPVPMVIGTDMEGIASEIEYRTGIKSFGFSTTGLNYYSQGIEMVDKKIVKRILMGDENERIEDKKLVNILGATPIDFGVTDTVDDLEKLLVEKGYKINATLWKNVSQEQIANMKNASCNIVVSNGGLWLANYLKSEYGIPFITELPFGKENCTDWLEKLQRCIETNGESILKCKEIVFNENSNNDILIIGEQIQSNSIRSAILKRYGKLADVGGICGWDNQFANVNDRYLETEEDIIEMLNQEKYKVVIGDILYKDLIRGGKKFIPYSHYAVSSKLGNEWGFNLIGEKFEKNILI